MTGVFCLLILIICVSLFNIESKAPDNLGNATSRIVSYLGILVFALLVGLRYNPEVDPDFLNYWYVAQYGSEYHEYHRFEIFPRLIAYLVQHFHLPPSAWFIVMGAILAYFTLFAACRLRNRFMPYVFSGLVLLYLSFDMNVMRQGIAISVFLCAITYIGERNWKKFLLFMIIAFCFHKTSIIWSFSYFLTYINWERRPILYFGLVAILSALAFKFLDLIIPKLGVIFSILGRGQVSELSDLNLMIMEERGTGFGVILRYIRWFFLLCYIPKIAMDSHDRSLLCIYALFVMGVIMDTYSMYSIILSRVAIYPKISELLLYPYIFTCCRNSFVKVIMYIQVILMTYVLYNYLNSWNFV